MEAPRVQALYQRFSGQPLSVVGINIQDTPAGRDKVMATYGLTYPMLVDEQGGTASTFNVRALPTTVLVDHRGLIRHQGHELPPDDLIRKILAEL